jgi:hypothetical protein
MMLGVWRKFGKLAAVEDPRQVDILRLPVFFHSGFGDKPPEILFLQFGVIRGLDEHPFESTSRFEKYSGGTSRMGRIVGQKIFDLFNGHIGGFFCLKWKSRLYS